MIGRKPNLSIVTTELSETEVISASEPPDELDFEAKLEWIRIAPLLASQGRLNDSTYALMMNFCINQGRVQKYEAMLQTDGLIISGRAHPAIKLQQESMREARMLAVELQLTRGAAQDESDSNREKASGWTSDLLA